jgi:hypothetical protein
MAQTDLYYKKTTNVAQTSLRSHVNSLLSPDRLDDYENVRVRTTESASNSPRNLQVMKDYVGAYVLSSSPSKRISPSMSPPEQRIKSAGLESQNQSRTLVGVITEYHASGRNSKIEKANQISEAMNPSKKAGLKAMPILASDAYPGK